MSRPQFASMKSDPYLLWIVTELIDRYYRVNLDDPHRLDNMTVEIEFWPSGKQTVYFGEAVSESVSPLS